MNIVVIMSGGIGKRFGSVVPKQYNLISGVPVIDYVIDAVKDSKLTDKVVVVIDDQWISYSDKLKNSGFDFVPNGDTRPKSMKNALDHIKKNYSCDNVLFADAVAPFIYGELIDDYFDKLKEYKAVITAQNITGGFTDTENTPLDREKFIITQSPEAFDFNLLYDNFDVDFKYQETAGMLPSDAKRYYNFDFKNNIKITYDFELKYVETMLKEPNHIEKKIEPTFFDKNILYTKGIKRFYYKNYKDDAEKFISKVYDSLKRIIIDYKLISFLPNQNSMYGLVIDAKSDTLGDIIIKFIPRKIDDNIINSFNREVESYQVLSKKYMCELIKVLEPDDALILRKIKGAKYGTFEDNILLTKFFDIVDSELCEYNDGMNLKYITDYYDTLNRKIENIDFVSSHKNEIKEELLLAKSLYDKYFINDKKYVLHLDIHAYNLLNDGKEMRAIDPNGFIAPKAFEYVRFIRNDIRTHKEFDKMARFDLLINYFSKYCDKKKLIAVFIIDLAFCNYNSTFENETDDETNDNIALLELTKKLI